MANNQNLTPWKSGVSGNPAGKPKGTKHISTLIQELLNDEEFSCWNANEMRMHKGAPLKALIGAQIQKALDGDTKAFESLLKHGYGGTTPEATLDKAQLFQMVSKSHQKTYDL